MKLSASVRAWLAFMAVCTGILLAMSLLFPAAEEQGAGVSSPIHATGTELTSSSAQNDQKISKIEELSRQAGLSAQHLTPTQFGCDGLADKPLREIHAGGIVKWTDDEGIIHYEDYQGDHAPEGLQVVTRFPDTKDYFSLDIRVASGGLPAGFRSSINQKAVWIYEFYRSLLDDNRLSRAEVHLVIHNRVLDYEQVRDQYVGHGAEEVPGFYIVSRNRAEILRQGSDVLTMKVMVHEVVHIINNQLFGQLPRWLNEGLATYIESLNTDQQRPSTAKERLGVIKKQVGLPLLGKVDIRQLLATEKQPWPLEKRADYYQFSQLLTTFLLQPENRNFSHPFLNELAAQKCVSLDVADYIAVHYKGGISGMEGDFRRWLRK